MTFSEFCTEVERLARTIPHCETYTSIELRRVVSRSRQVPSLSIRAYVAAYCRFDPAEMISDDAAEGTLDACLIKVREVIIPELTAAARKWIPKETTDEPDALALASVNERTDAMVEV